MNLLVQENFLPYPDIIRAWALQQEFIDADETVRRTGLPNTWPGLRSAALNELNKEFADIVLGRISHLAQYHFGVPSNLHIRSAFQLTRADDGNSWIHQDHDVDVAALVYLSPNAPKNSGTILYTPPPHEEVDVIGNVYNRLIMYRSDTYHKSNQYFGSNIDDGRLTLVCFVKAEK